MREKAAFRQLDKALTPCILDFGQHLATDTINTSIEYIQVIKITSLHTIIIEKSSTKRKQYNE